MVSAVSRTERRKSMEKPTNRKNISLLNELLHINSACMWMTLITVVINIFGAWFRYDRDKGFVFGSQIAAIMLTMFLAVVIAVNVSSNYTFISTLPVKISDIHIYMSLTLDLAFIIIIAADAVTFALFNMAVHIPVRMISHLFMYIFSHILLYATTTPGGSKQDSQRTTILSAIMGFMGYFISIVSNAIVSSVIDDNTSYSKSGKIAIAIILGVLFVSAVITRILTNKGIKSKLRLMKVYKGKKKSKKAESYV